MIHRGIDVRLCAFTSASGFLCCHLLFCAATWAGAQRLPTVTTRSASPLGTDALTVNGSIQPHGLLTTYYFEYGSTTAYGMKTTAAPLPPRLAAFYRESWDD